MKNTFMELVRERSRLIKIPVVVGSLIIAAGVLATYGFSNYLSERAADDFQMQTNEQATIFATTIESRTDEFEQILLMMAAYSRDQPNMPKAQWGQFIQESKILTRHPFLVGVGYADAIPANQRDAYNQARAAETPGFAITPAGDRDFYTSIRYLEPETQANNSVVGFDMYSEATRRAAMSSARDKGTVAITSPVHLLQDSEFKDKYGVIVYYPVYRNGQIPATVAERREQNIGYTFVAFRPSDFIAAIDAANPTQLSSASYAITDSSSSISMTSKVYTPQQSETKYNATKSANIIDRQWVVGLTAYQPIFQRWTAPGITFILGIVTSFTLGGVVTYLMTRRLIRLDTQHQTEIQRTKDELLALTSHQLRTPASGVKQYVGMLLQGFVGDLSPQQEAIAKKAFAANERQLETINQLLHVAKADADQLVLQKEEIDLVDLTHQIMDSMKDSVDDHESEIIVKSPKKPITIAADERYLRMVIENLISNALKYSENGKPIRITLASRQHTAMLSVRDYGVGVSEEDLVKLFKKFSRIPNPLSKTVGGSGLGLFLAEQIMLAHGGDIEVDSKLGRGSIFTLTLPINEDEINKKGL
jgi:signal transduction histidine kinase